MTTIFSNPTLLPWVRETPRFPTTSFPNAHSAITRAGDGLAVAAWGERVDRAGGPLNYSYSSPLTYLAGVRYTETGPEVAQDLIEYPSDSTTRTGLSLDALFSVGDEAWALFSHDDWEVPANSQYRMAKLVVDPSTLEVSVSWRWSLPKNSYSYDPALVDVWPGQRRVVIATTVGSTSGGKPTNAIYLVDLDLGTLIAWQATPLRSTSASYPHNISINPTTGRVLFLGERIISGRVRAAIWTAPITASTLGAFTYHMTFPVTVTATDYYPEKFDLLVRSDGRWEYAGSQYPPYTSLRHGFYTYATTMTEDLDVLDSRFSGWISTFGKPVSLVRDSSLGRTVLGYTTYSDRTSETPGTYGGVYHLELDESAITDALLLPGTDFAVRPDNIQCVNFDDGRFLYMLGAIGVNQAYVNDFSSYGFNVWAAGPDQVAPLPPGIKGEAPSEGKSYFRRVN